MGKDVIIACDFSSAADVYAFLDKFTGKKPFAFSNVFYFQLQLLVQKSSASRG